MSWVRFDEGVDVQEENPVLGESRTTDPVDQAAGEVSQILDMLRRLDSTKLRKIKELIRIAFLED